MNILRRVKTMFKRKPKKDRTIEQNENGNFILKDKVPYKVDPYIPEITEELDLPSNMKLHTKYKGKKIGSTNLFLFEINGVLLTGEDILSVQRKYLRTKGYLK